MQPDGTVLINTKINTDGVEIYTKDIESTLKRSTEIIGNYDKEIMDYVDNYVKNMESASKSNNEFKHEIESLSKQLDTLEGKGLYFGDEEYDNTYLKLQKVQQALKDYKKELTSPTPNALPLDTSTLEGRIDKLALDLQKLKENGKTFGDKTFDSTYKAFQKANEELKAYKSQLIKPVEIPVEISAESMQGQIKALKSQLEMLSGKGKTFGDTEYDQTALSLKRAEQALVDYKNELFKTDEQRQKEAESAQRQAEQQTKLNQKLEEAKQKEADAAAESSRLAEIGQNAKISSPYIIRLREEISKLSARQKDLEKAELGFGYKEYDENAARIQKMNAALKKYQSNTESAEKSTKKMNTALKGTKKSTDKARFGIGRMLATSLLFSTVFRAISAVTSGLKEGMDNLAQYSDNTNKALSLLMSSMTQLKNSFATAFSPLVEVAAPALAQLINLLSQAVTWTAQLLAALTGKDTFVKAVKVQQDYADSLDKTKDETKDAAKEIEKLLAPFDKLIQITAAKKKDKNDKEELKPEDMFTTEEISNDIKFQAETIKQTLGQLFAPLKQSWLENGPQVMDSVKNTFSAVKQLASDVSASFMQIWNAEGYGKAITDDLLITFSNLTDTVGNLVSNFDEAWVSGNTGTSILRHLGDIILEITDFLRRASESLKNWSADLDFSPLLQSFDRVLVAIRPIVSTVGDAILWLLDNALEPIAKWGIEQALPAVFNLIAAALNAVHNVILALKPLALWLWDNFLQPLGEWTGKIIIAALQKLTEWLTKFSNWIKQHQVAVENFTLAVIAFFAAWSFANFITGMSGLISKLGGFIGIAYRVIGTIGTSIMKINTLNLTIAGIISLIAILAKNWKSMSPTEKVIASILAAASAVGILAVALGALAGGVGAAVVAASLAAAIGAATIAINAGQRSVSSGHSNYSGYPVSAYSAVPYKMPMLATGTVIPPRAGIRPVLVGDAPETEIIAPESKMKQAFKEAMSEMGGMGNGNITIKFSGNLAQLARLLNPEIENENRRVGIRMVTEGTT